MPVRLPFIKNALMPAAAAPCPPSFREPIMSTIVASIRFARIGHAVLLFAGAGTTAARGQSQEPRIAPIGVAIDKYLDVPASARGAAIDPNKGYRLQELGQGLFTSQTQLVAEELSVPLTIEVW